MSFTVAIVGRPNVGKSTLFNRLVGKKLALVDDTPGVTRDRRPGDARLVDLKFRIIDTAGLEEAAPETLQGRMRAQTEAAIDEADLSLFVVDAKMGLTPVDQALAEMLRKKGKPVVLVANKSEARGSDGGFYDSYTLGLGEPTPISAERPAYLRLVTAAAPVPPVLPATLITSAPAFATPTAIVPMPSDDTSFTTTRTRAALQSWMSCARSSIE